MEIRSVPEAKQESWWGNHREKLRDFYTKYLDVEGIGIMGSDHVSDNAFYRAKEIVLKLTSKNLKFRTDLSGMRFMLAAQGTSIQGLPELRDFQASPYGYACISTDGVVHFCASMRCPTDTARFFFFGDTGRHTESPCVTPIPLVGYWVLGPESEPPCLASLWHFRVPPNKRKCTT